MKRTLTLYADVPPGDGVFLLEIAVGLGGYRLRPENLTWSLTGKDKVKLGIVIACDHEPHVRELIERFQGLHGVTKIESEAPPAPDVPVITD